MGIFSPDFIERDGHVFWCPNAKEYISQKFPLMGLRKTESGDFVQSDARENVERYRNNFSVNQFFTKWEGLSDSPVFKVGLSEAEYRLCYIFANQIARYWHAALLECFPDRIFEFEIGDDLLDEYGVCLTFWQTSG